MKKIYIIVGLLFVAVIIVAANTLFFIPKEVIKQEKVKAIVMEKGEKEIYFAGGCFWGTEHFFKQVNGVTETESGYANGTIADPTYHQVTTGKTGFAETVRVLYNPEVVDLSLLIDLYFKTIDPTSLNKQGNDVGTQYRTGIYYTNAEDEKLIQTKLEELAKQYDKALQIECSPLKNFYDAENYHQDYLDKNPGGYCHIDPSLFDYAKKANRKD